MGICESKDGKNSISNSNNIDDDDSNDDVLPIKRRYTFTTTRSFRRHSNTNDISNERLNGIKEYDNNNNNNDNNNNKLMKEVNHSNSKKLYHNSSISQSLQTNKGRAFFLESTPFSLNMIPSFLVHFSKCFNLVCFQPNTIIFNQGENADILYIIAEGQVDLFVPKKKPVIHNDDDQKAKEFTIKDNKVERRKEFTIKDNKVERRETWAGNNNNKNNELNSEPIIATKNGENKKRSKSIFPSWKFSWKRSKTSDVSEENSNMFSKNNNESDNSDKSNRYALKIDTISNDNNNENEVKYGTYLCTKQEGDYLGSGYGHGSLLGITESRLMRNRRLMEESYGSTQSLPNELPQNNSINDDSLTDKVDESKNALNNDHRKINKSMEFSISRQNNGQTNISLNPDGTLPLFLRGQHGVTAVTGQSYVTCLSLHRRDLERYLLQFPGMKDVILTSLGHGLEDSLKNLTFLKGLSGRKLHQLALLFHFVTLPAKSILFREWDSDIQNGNSLFYLYTGSVEVLITDEETLKVERVAVVKKGNFFGEISLIINTPRTATIRALEPCLLMELKSTNFKNFLKLAPEALEEFSSKLAAYSISLKHLICSDLALEYFCRHLRSEYSEENILFWIECQEFQRIAKRDVVNVDDLVDNDTIKEKAKQIINNFILNGAPQQVNLDGTVQNDVILKYKTNPVDPNLFTVAANEILELMDRDSFFRFRTSKLFKEFIASVNCNLTPSIHSSSFNASSPNISTGAASSSFGWMNKSAAKNNRSLDVSISHNPLTPTRLSSPLAKQTRFAFQKHATNNNSNPNSTNRSNSSRLNNNISNDSNNNQSYSKLDYLKVKNNSPQNKSNLPTPSMNQVSFNVSSMTESRNTSRNISENKSDDILHGVIFRMVRDKNYGFILPRDARSNNDKLFFHFNESLSRQSLIHTLSEGDLVTYVKTTSSDGREMAINIAMENEYAQEASNRALSRTVFHPSQMNKSSSQPNFKTSSYNNNNNNSNNNNNGQRRALQHSQSYSRNMNNYSSSYNNYNNNNSSYNRRDFSHSQSYNNSNNNYNNNSSNSNSNYNNNNNNNNEVRIPWFYGLIHSLRRKYGFISRGDIRELMFFQVRDVQITTQLREGLVVKYHVKDDTIAGLTAYDIRELTSAEIYNPKKHSCIFRKTFDEEEDLCTEFKSLENTQKRHGINNKIIKDAEKYINAFMNREGGSIYFGIMDNGEIIGVRLDRRQRDELRITLDRVFRECRPAITQYHIEFLPVYRRIRAHPTQQFVVIIYNRFVVKISVEKTSNSYGQIYYARNNRVYIRTEGGINEMKAQQMEEILQKGNAKYIKELFDDAIKRSGVVNDGNDLPPNYDEVFNDNSKVAVNNDNDNVDDDEDNEDNEDNEEDEEDLDDDEEEEDLSDGNIETNLPNYENYLNNQNNNDIKNVYSTHNSMTNDNDKEILDTNHMNVPDFDQKYQTDTELEEDDEYDEDNNDKSDNNNNTSSMDNEEENLAIALSRSISLHKTPWNINNNNEHMSLPSI